MDKEIEDAAKLTKEDLIAKMKNGQPADLIDGLTASPVLSVDVWRLAPTFVPASMPISA